MQIHLVLPGLLWPAAQAKNHVRDLPLPSLSALLGHGSVHFDAPCAPDVWLAQHFGLRAPLPLAALRRLGETGLPPAPPDSAWLCADPVYLHFAREHLILSDAAELGLTMAEAAALVAELNQVFPDLGQFEVGAPDRWYLRLAQAANATFYPLSDVSSRPVAHFLPEGPEAALWGRTMNEAQIVLHNHPVNQAREGRGQGVANSLWLWGAGGTLPPLTPPARRIQALGPVARGLARATGVEPTVPALPGEGEDSLIVLEDLLRPALYLDLDRWREALMALETAWFAPLLAALKARRIHHLKISAPGDRATLQLDVEAGQLWKFWHKPRNLEDTLPPAP